ncbi:MAG TPA: baseplate J/gp47 family protein [Patescibacteria group bacterium]|nr:baseplate J/gp47 family protein [Patescibacteria group bacterium]
MANVPLPKSYNQILGEMLASYMGKIGVNDVNVGGAMVSFFECMAQAIYRSSGDTFAILRDFSVDRARAEALKRLAKEERVLPIPAQVATGKVTVSDTRYTKIATKIYAGSNPPTVGSIVIKVSDASLFTPTGAIYIGRGTPNIEGPISYTSIVAVGSFYEINLSSATTKYHNISESVILAQGGTRNIPIGTTVKTRTLGSSPVVSFTTTQAAIILDGEVEIANVSVAAQEPGTDSNIPRGAIVEFASVPFEGASVTNPNPFTTGKNEETDEEIRNRIKKSRSSKGLGTTIAVKNSVLGAQSDDDNSIVTSNEMFSDGENTTLYIDNGEGYEEKDAGVGVEYIVDSALGGETHFQLATGGSQTSVRKAFLESTEISPFSVSETDRLAVLIGGALSEHVFNIGDFKNNGYATAYEIVASINADPELTFVAQTSNNGTKVVITSKNEDNEYLQITDPTTGTDSAIALGFQRDEVQTLRLYKNKEALSRSGRSASVESENQTDWSNTLVSGESLILKVDGTQFITYIITDADFIAEGTHASLAKTNNLQSWINVFNSKLIGVTATINGTRIILASNLGNKSRASLEIDSSSTLVVKGMFSQSNGLTAQGREADFIFSRNTAQFKLTHALSVGDSLTAGTEFTQASVSSSKILGGNVTLSNDAYLWLLIDKPNTIINHGVVADSIVHLTKEVNNTIRIRSQVTDAFSGVLEGDYIVLWSDEFNPENRIEGRVCSVGTQIVSNDYIELRLTASEYAATSDQSTIVFSEGLVIVRSQYAPQKIKMSAGSYDINTIASTLSSTLEGGYFSVENDEYLIITSKNMGLDGSITIVAINEAAKGLNFTLSDSSQSITSHFAFNDSEGYNNEFPIFIHSSVSADESADVPNSFLSDFTSTTNLSTLGVDPNEIVCMLHPYLFSGSEIKDNSSYNECVQIKDLTGAVVDINQNNIMRRLRVNDRYFLANPLDFSYNDSLITILDNDPSTKTFPISLYRKALTNNSMSVNADSFRAYDIDSGLTETFDTYFGSSYSFNNYKVFMKAKNVIDPNSSTDEDAILYRAAIWGRGGEKYNIGYTYPTANNLGISHTIVISDLVRIRLSLKSGSAVPNTIDGTTQWDITITANTPVAGVEEVTYTYNSVGTNPSMNSLVAGNYVTINTNGDFSVENTGTFRISSATSSSFTVRRPSGSAVAENNIATLENNTISLFEDSDTTAQELVDYVTANLSDFIIASVIGDNGTTGAGVIDLSTYEDNSFVVNTDGISLLDGINWILESDVDAVAPAANFTFKNSLSLPNYNTNTANAYVFNDGEDLRLVPTTSKQVVDLISTLVVSGFSTLGKISTTDMETKLQLASLILGSNGSLQITGGSANKAEGSFLSSSTSIPNTNYIRSSISRSAASGLHAGQWIKLIATYSQKKDLGISTTTNVTITPNVPTAGQSKVEFGNRENYDLYFGQPRNHIRDEGRAFHVEKHGSLVCISWDGITGSAPVFTKSVEINADNGGISVNYDNETGYTSYTVESGSRNFLEAMSEDTIVIQNMADTTNNGTFKVVGVSDDGNTIVTDNAYGVDAASAIVNSANITISTAIKEGDNVEIGSPFAAVNQGIFRVIRKYENSIYIDNPSAGEERVVVSSNFHPITIDSSTEFDIVTTNDMRIEWNGNGVEPDFSVVNLGDIVEVGTTFDVDNQGKFMVTKIGDNWIECCNALAVSETGITVSGVGADILRIHQPALKFHPYENTVEGDKLVISGTVLTEANRGTYSIVKILDKNSIIVGNILTSQSSVPLASKHTQVYVEELEPYVGYKKIYTMAVDPSNSNRYVLVFDSNEQVSKINKDSGAVIFEAMGKLNFSESIVKGLDSYRYHTGLISEANKIVYGEPRDSITYPGVAAAGAEIFIKPPLKRRIEVSINVRVQTGIPFNRIVEQVRNNIAALINGSPIGQSIAISDIISTVNSIPGTKAVSITSPSYSPANDVIVINAAEKPFILDIVNDITVAKVGA